MPQIKTRGKNPGISLTQGERTRWQATIDDLAVCGRNATNEHEATEYILIAENLGSVLARLSPKDEENGEPAKDTKSPNLKPA